MDRSIVPNCVYPHLAATSVFGVCCYSGIEKFPFSEKGRIKATVLSELSFESPFPHFRVFFVTIHLAVQVQSQTQRHKINKTQNLFFKTHQSNYE
jgi:hypothetical protein